MTVHGTVLNSASNVTMHQPPGLRLIGTAGERRLATADEKAAYRARVKLFRGLKGYDLIWRDLNHVREIKLERCEPVRHPQMTEHLWR